MVRPPTSGNVRPGRLQRPQEPEGDIWMVIAVVQPFRLDAITLALEALPHFGGMTVSDCRGFGHGKVDDEADRGELTLSGAADSLVDFTPKLRLEIVVSGREQADAVVKIIARAAHTGRRGDGKIFVSPIARAVRVRTFAEGEQAL